MWQRSDAKPVRPQRSRLAFSRFAVGLVVGDLSSALCENLGCKKAWKATQPGLPAQIENTEQVGTGMLVIYRDGSGSAHTIDADNPIVDPLPFKEKAEAETALVRARKLQPEVNWRVVGRGPFGVHQVWAIGLNGKWPEGMPQKPMVQNIDNRPVYAWCPACGQELDLEDEMGSINEQWKKVDDRFSEHVRSHPSPTTNLPWP